MDSQLLHQCLHTWLTTSRRLLDPVHFDTVTHFSQHSVLHMMLERTLSREKGRLCEGEESDIRKREKEGR